MTRTQIKDMIWHGGKTLLCALQLLILFLVVRGDFASIDADGSEEIHILSALAYLIYPAIITALFIALWRYYDNVDDRSFDKVCKAETPPQFLRDPAYLLGIGLTALTVTPILASSFRPFFQYLRFGPWATATAILVSMAITAGGSALRISRLNETWIIQSKLPKPKNPSGGLRIFYAVTYFVALLIISKAAAVAVLLAFAVLFFFFLPILIIVGLALLWCFFILPALNCIPRRKFMSHLQELRDKGKISYEIHGHPYLSLFIRRVPFGLTVTHVPHPDTEVPKETVYKVTFANCMRRREIIVLCDGYVYQFLYTLKFNQIDRFSRMGANKSEARTVSIPGAARFVSHTFDFPEGEGERILLIDPTPHILALRDVAESCLFELDNASHIFDYTVYGKNSFLRLLERK